MALWKGAGGGAGGCCARSSSSAVAAATASCASSYRGGGGQAPAAAPQLLAEAARPPLPPPLPRSLSGPGAMSGGAASAPKPLPSSGPKSLREMPHPLATSSSEEMGPALTPSPDLLLPRSIADKVRPGGRRHGV